MFGKTMGLGCLEKARRGTSEPLVIALAMPLPQGCTFGTILASDIVVRVLVKVGLHFFGGLALGAGEWHAARHRWHGVCG